MKTETQLFYIGTSRVKQIQGEYLDISQLTLKWGTKTKWKQLSKPKASSKKVKLKKKAKSKYGKATSWKTGGVTVMGTAIPATVSRNVQNVNITRNVAVRYRTKKLTKYTKTKKLTKKKKMMKYVYSQYLYQLQYQDVGSAPKVYSKYEDGIEYIFFSNTYYDSKGKAQQPEGHLSHPVSCKLTYSDVRKNFNIESNNDSSGRDNSGTFLLSNVRANVVTLELTWNGLGPEEGGELLETLNPEKDSKGNYPYLIVQYFDPATRKVKNGTFYAEDRNAEKYPNGYFNEITVTLVEV